jgi:ketosteroid isomerase-like protein
MTIERPTDAHRLFEQLFNAGDLEGLVALYEEHAKLVLPQGEVTGRDAIRQGLAAFIDLNGKMRMETVGVVESDGIAITSGTWRLESENGKLLLQGESVEVFRKTNHGWLAAIDCPFGVG